ncbi:MAG: hypothetical protein HC912_12315 [Saprospiraceae bacterium]|nr:hypothetical protein [Saprospiraceae bacterium]
MDAISARMRPVDTESKLGIGWACTPVAHTLIPTNNNSQLSLGQLAALLDELLESLLQTATIPHVTSYGAASKKIIPK